jgi:hypothetical protein
MQAAKLEIIGIMQIKLSLRATNLGIIYLFTKAAD